MCTSGGAKQSCWKEKDQTQHNPKTSIAASKERRGCAQWLENRVLMVRYKGQSTAKQNQRQCPHWVDVPIPEGGSGRRHHSKLAGSRANESASEHANKAVSQKASGYAWSPRDELVSRQDSKSASRGASKLAPSKLASSGTNESASEHANKVMSQQASGYARRPRERVSKLMH